MVTSDEIASRRASRMRTECCAPRVVSQIRSDAVNIFFLNIQQSSSCGCCTDQLKKTNPYPKNGDLILVGIITKDKNGLFVNFWTEWRVRIQPTQLPRAKYGTRSIIKKSKVGLN